MSNVVRLVNDLLARREYQTAYAFNSLVAPRFKFLLSKGFKFVEYATNPEEKFDSQGQTYATLLYQVNTTPDGVIPLELSKSFFETVEESTQGYNTCISWLAPPHATVREFRVGEKQRKEITLQTAFTVR